MAKKNGTRVVPIVHMRLDYRIARDAGDIEVLDRIRAINKYLGAMETALTESKMRGSPIAMLLERRAIGGEEFMAAQDIELAFMTIAGGLMFKPMGLERVDRSNAGSTPNTKADAAARRYQSWASHWSDRAKRGDRTLEIVVAAIIDMRAFSAIEADVGIRHGLAKTVTIRGLRDYAAQAGWAERKQTEAWKTEAEKSFPCRPAAGRIIHTELKAAIIRAQTA